MIIRAAIHSDRDFVLECAKPFEIFGSYQAVVAGLLQKHIEYGVDESVNAPTRVYVCECEAGKPAGFVVASFMRIICDIKAIAVLPEYRRAGVAGMLLDFVLGRCAELGVEQVVSLTAETQNVAALGFFQARGFVPQGLVGTYMRGQAALKLQLDLQAPMNVDLQQD